MATVIKDLVNWLQQWFYTESEVDTLLSAKSDNSHTHGNLSNDGKVSNTSSAVMLYFVGVGSSSNTLYKSNKLSSETIIDTTAHLNIGSSANDTQQTINTKIDDQFDALNTLISNAINYINQ